MAKNLTAAASKLIGSVSEMGKIIGVNPAFLKIIPDYNVREAFDSVNDTDDASLKASLRDNGWRGVPVTVRRNGADLYVVSGHRRLAAVLELIEEKAWTGMIPCMSIDYVPNTSDLLCDLIVSNSGKAITSIARGKVFLAMRKVGMKDIEIALRTGLSDKYIREVCALWKADKSVIAYVKAGVISATLASQIVVTHGDAAPAIIKAAASDPATQAGGKGRKAGTISAGTLANAEIAVTGSAPVTARTSAVKGAAGQAARKGAPPAPAGTKAAPRPAAPAMLGKPNGAEGLATLDGPFVVGGTDGDDIHDRNGAGLANCDSPAIARAMVVFLNAGWDARNGAKVAFPATVPAAALIKAVNGAPVKDLSRRVGK